MTGTPSAFCESPQGAKLPTDPMVTSGPASRDAGGKPLRVPAVESVSEKDSGEIALLFAVNVIKCVSYGIGNAPLKSKYQIVEEKSRKVKDPREERPACGW